MATTFVEEVKPHLAVTHCLLGKIILFTFGDHSIVITTLHKGLIND
jgi:hypothetical protein